MIGRIPRLPGLAVVLALTLALLVVWWRALSRGDLGYLALQQAPEGASVTLSLFRITEVRPAGYTVARGQLSVDVRADPGDLAVGTEVSVGGTFHAGQLVEAWREPAPDRRAKKALGFLGLALGGGIALATIRVTPDGLSLRG